MGAGSIPVFAHGDDPASVSETDILPTEIPVVDDEDREPTPYTPEGNMTLVDDIGSPNEPGKQFITVVSKKGNYFYIVIDRDKNGNEIVYTITEDPVAGYDTKIEGYKITNTHTPETTLIEGSKTWDDDYDRDEMRPTSITIHLYADGAEIQSKTVTKADGWKWNFGNLPKYKDGKLIQYTIIF